MTSLLTLGIIEGKYTVNNDHNYLEITRKGYFEIVGESFVSCAMVTYMEYLDAFKINFRDILFYDDNFFYKSVYVTCPFEQSKQMVFDIIEQFIETDINCDDMQDFFLINVKDMPFFNDGKSYDVKKNEINILKFIIPKPMEAI